MNKREISVLHILLSTSMAGMETVVYNLAVNHDRSRLKISVGCFDEIGFLSEKMSEIGIESMLIPRMIPGVSMFFPWKLIKFIRRSGCDIVHTHSGCWQKVAAACAFVPGVKLIYTDHGRGFPEVGDRIFWDRLSIRMTDRVVAVSEPLRRYLIETVKLPEKKIVTILNGVDTERYKPSENRRKIRAEFGFTDEHVIIGIVAGLRPVKNHVYLLDAFRIVSQKCSQARLMIIGDGILRAELEKAAEERGLNETVIFTGERHDIPDLLGSLDISTLCSLSEGLSISLLETLSSGLPVVVTAVGGNPTVITDGKNGFLVEVGNETAYARKLIDLVESPDLRKRIGDTARADIITRWSIKQTAESYQKLYEELLGTD